jgi:cell division inhibitor SulA
LTAPAGDAGTIGAMLAELTAIEDRQALQRAAAQGDRASFQTTLGDCNEHNAGVQAEAQAYGLSRCHN